MDREELFKKISIENDQKILLLVLDGLGGLPINGKTELETAVTPNLNLLASESELGLTHPICPGVTPGSGPAHLSLFGIDPLKYPIGRGVLEALGIGVNVGERDVAIRGNFATHQDGIIVDRRAGRISSQKNKELIDYLKQKIKTIEDIQIQLYPGEEHRFVLILSGNELSDNVTDADPEAVEKPFCYAQAKSAEAQKSARILNLFIDQVTKELMGFSPANTCLLRGAAQYPTIPTLKDIFKVKAVAVASYPMYRGLARLVGMTILDTGSHMEDLFNTVRDHWHLFDFFFVHIKKTDSYGEDGNFNAKVKVIEQFDSLLPNFLQLSPDVLVITGDHSTPASMKSHSWHPNPVLLKAKFQRRSFQTKLRFDEKYCSAGVLGHLLAMDILPLMMANAFKLKKFGA